MVTDSRSKRQLRFSTRVQERARAIKSWLSIGIDPDTERLPSEFPRDASGITDFCLEVMLETSHVAAAFKVNFAFFEVLGPAGWTALERLRREAPSDVPLIADAKRGDVPNTARMYARSIFDVLDFDAVTVNPFLGWDSLQPFLDYRGKGVFILCKTSNPGASEFQDLDVGGQPLYLRIARETVTSSVACDAGLVVGATQPAALQAVRALSPDVLILAPGVGAQGASASEAMVHGANMRGENLLANVSRAVLHASSGSDYLRAAVQAAERRAMETWEGRHAAE